MFCGPAIVRIRTSFGIFLGSVYLMALNIYAYDHLGGTQVFGAWGGHARTMEAHLFYSNLYLGGIQDNKHIKIPNLDAKYTHKILFELLNTGVIADKAIVFSVSQRTRKKQDLSIFMLHFKKINCPLEMQEFFKFKCMKKKL